MGVELYPSLCSKSCRIDPRVLEEGGCQSRDQAMSCLVGCVSESKALLLLVVNSLRGRFSMGLLEVALLKL